MLFFAFGLFLIAIWDAVTTFLGLLQILGGDTAIIVSGIVTLAIFLLLAFGTKMIFSSNSSNPGLGCILGPVWLVATTFNIYTSFIANAKFFVVTTGFSSSAQTDVLVLIREMRPEQIVIALVITVIVSGSTLILSFFITK
jgi:hypothetical protein